MDFNDVVLGRIQADPANECLKIVEDVIALAEQESPEGWTQHDYKSLTEVFALLLEVQEAGLIDFPTLTPTLQGVRGDDCIAMLDFLREARTHLSAIKMRSMFQTMRGRFRNGLSSAFSYQFSAGDLSRIQELINALREQIGKQGGLEDEHRDRLLRRLEKLQSELHKKMSDLDRFWGLIGDAGVVLGKLGSDAKPIVDRIREITDIVWQTQSRSEELPSGSSPPLLEKSKDDVSA